MITLAILTKVIKTTPSAKLTLVVDPINKTCTDYDISNINRVAAFVSQICHESGGYMRFVENLNYSAQGLMKTWPSHFPTLAIANQYAHNSTKIAARAYAARMGNGDEASGDGALYLGRGAIQLTGKAIYSKFADYKKMKLVDIVAYLETIEGALDSAGWFWSVAHKLNPLADKQDMHSITQIINGGQNGASERLAYFEAFRAALMVS